MVSAIFIDFYGTVVHEDGDLIKQICQEIKETGVAKDISEIGRYWSNEFQTSFLESYGESFKTQRELEYESLQKTIQHFQSSVDVKQLCNMMFEHWIKPPIFEESKEFFEKCPVPIYIVSNIDRKDILKAVDFHGLKPNNIFTSEDARSYKPRKELFEYALKATGHNTNEVIHIGDSLSSDVKGATSMGIKAIWVNRSCREVPDGVISVSNLFEIYNKDFFQ